jgi:beta-glucosidase
VKLRVSLALTLVAVASCQRAPRKPPAPGALPVYRDPDRTPAERAADLVGRMTVSEKIAQTMTAATAIPRLGVPAYEWWNEALHGVARAGRATVFPQAIALAATFDEALMRRVATVVSDEGRAKFNLAQARGIRSRYHGLTFFSPNVNIFRDPRWGRGHETFGEDPLLTARMGVAFITGMQGDDPRYWKTVATAKHFAVHSGPEADRHVFDARVSAHDLADTYLPHFEVTVREGRVASIMAAYNRVGGEAAVASQTLLAGTLRARWGFTGYVVGDCGAVADVYQHHKIVTTAAEAAALSLRAGTDLDCGRAYASLNQALVRGLIEEADLDRAVIRLFTARFRLGMFDPPDRVPWSGLGAETVEATDHLALAREAAARSIVLLENRGALPLGPSVRRLAVIGPTADNLPVLLANYNGTPSRPVKLLDGVRAAAAARGMSVAYAAGSRLIDTSDSAIAAAVAVAGAADVVIAVVGLDPRMEGEEGEKGMVMNPSGDKRDLELPAAQQRLLDAVIGAGRPVIVVLTGGSALALARFAERVAGLLAVWYPGAEGGRAVADVLFGDANPAGRLPVTFYRSTDDLPPFADYTMRGRTYRYFDGQAQYGFGYGLSYTAFRYTGAAARMGAFATVTVDVDNTGGRAGDEVVQVYVMPRGAPAYAPHRWLAAFTRISLAAGERRTVRLPLARDALTLVDDIGARRPLTGIVEIAIGGRQPDRAGHYASDAQGVTLRLNLD